MFINCKNRFITVPDHLKKAKNSKALHEFIDKSGYKIISLTCNCVISATKEKENKCQTINTNLIN